MYVLYNTTTHNHHLHKVTVELNCSQTHSSLIK